MYVKQRYFIYTYMTFSYNMYWGYVIISLPKQIIETDAFFVFFFY